MEIRHPSLPPGWYPGNEGAVNREIKKWLTSAPEKTGGIAAIVPHAGWSFSGRLACLGMAGMKGDFSALVVAGGHLHRGSRLHLAEEEIFLLPNGVLRNHFPLTDFLKGRMDWTGDPPGDNTVEVQLPLVRYFWGEIPVTALRVPPDETALELAAYLRDWEAETGETLGFIGSTDLTHYGRSYGFSPKGSGPAALDWVRRENDARILAAMEAGNAREILELAAKDRSACSAGAAAAAAEFARLGGRDRGQAAGYYTSYDVVPGDSFVGYGAVVY